MSSLAVFSPQPLKKRMQPGVFTADSVSSSSCSSLAFLSAASVSLDHMSERERERERETRGGLEEKTEGGMNCTSTGVFSNSRDSFLFLLCLFSFQLLSIEVRFPTSTSTKKTFAC